MGVGYRFVPLSAAFAISRYFCWPASQQAQALRSQQTKAQLFRAKEAPVSLARTLAPPLARSHECVQGRGGVSQGVTLVGM